MCACSYFRSSDRIVDQSDRKFKTSFAIINLGLYFDVLINDELILS